MSRVQPSAGQGVVPPLGHAIGGALGSALALLLFYPLERARIEMQSNVAQSEQREREQIANVGGSNPNMRVRSDEAIKVVDATGEGGSNLSDASQSSSSDASWVSCLASSEQGTAATQEHERTDHEQSQNHQGDGLVPTISRLYGNKELYQGAGSIVVTLATSNFVFFYAHQVIQRLLSERQVTKNKSALVSLFGSSIAGMVNVLLTNPLWVANLNIVKGSKLSLWRELQAIVQSEGEGDGGWKTLWNGTGASLLLVSNPVLQFFVYDVAKASIILRKHRRGRSGGTAGSSLAAAAQSATSLSPLEAFCIGALAKAIATIATYPLQLAQVLLRMQKNSGRTNPSTRSTRNTWDCLKQQYGRGGISALYTGMNAKLLQTVLTAAFTFLTYEQILRVVRAALLMSSTATRRS